MVVVDGKKVKGVGVFLAFSVNSVKFREMTRGSNPRNLIRWQKKVYGGGVADVAERSFKDRMEGRMAKIAGGREARCMDNDKSRGYMGCCTCPNRPSGVKWWGLFDASFQRGGVARGWAGWDRAGKRCTKKPQAFGQREILFVPRTRFFFFFLPRQAKLQRSYRVARGHTPCCSTGSDAAGAPPLSISPRNVFRNVPFCSLPKAQLLVGALVSATLHEAERDAITPCHPNAAATALLRR